MRFCCNQYTCYRCQSANPSLFAIHSAVFQTFLFQPSMGLSKVLLNNEKMSRLFLQAQKYHFDTEKHRGVFQNLQNISGKFPCL